MLHRRKYPSQQEIKTALNYNPATGIFHWRMQPNKPLQWNAKYTGKIAGSTTRRYVIIQIDRKPFQAHRLAWIYVYGDKPFGDLDHKNRNKHDNKIENLRLVNRSQNMRNYLLSKNNLSGIRGVTWNKQHFRWEVKIKVNGISIYLGIFKKFDDAIKARYNAEIKYGFTKMNEESTAFVYLKKQAG